MKKLFLLCLLSFICNILPAQSVLSYYKVLENGLSGSPSLTDTVYKSGDRILLEEASSFSFQRLRNGVTTVVKVTNKYGSFEVDSLFRIAQNEMLSRHGNKSSKVSKAASQHKSADSTMCEFTSKIARFFNEKQSHLIEYGLVDVTRENRTLRITNISKNEDMFVDIVWEKDGLLMSALSFHRNFSNNSVLYPGESMNCTVNQYVEQEQLYVICTPYPIEYNTIRLDDINTDDMSREMFIPLTIIPVP